MARTRNIKPGFFKNEELAECNPLARILFAGLWTIADREGRLEDRPKRIKAEILPYDDGDVDALLDQLQERGFVERYSTEGEHYLQVHNWVRHQQPHYKEEASNIPAPPGHQDSGYSAQGVTEEKRQEIFQRDNYKCRNCGRGDKLTLDHIVPRSKGGTGDSDNLQTLCGSCNATKNNRLAAAEAKTLSDEANSTSVQGRSDVGSTESLDDSLKHTSLNSHPHPSSLNSQAQEGARVRGSSVQGRADVSSTEQPLPLDNATFAFEQFWGHYPRDRDGMRPGSKGKARTQFEKLSTADWDLVMIGLSKYSEQDKVKRGYVMSAETWLRERKWREAIDAEPLPEVKSGGTHKQEPSKRSQSISAGFEGAFGVPMEQVLPASDEGEIEDHQASNIRRFPRAGPSP